MSTANTRRDFLRMSTAGLAAGAVAEAVPAWSSLRSANPGAGEIAVRVTDEKRRFESAPPVAWHQRSGQKPWAQIITLNSEKKFQEILGFGAVFTDAACYMFNQLSADSRERLFHELFHPSELALNVCRTCIGASDYSTEVYSFDEGLPDPDLKRFSIDHDRAYILPPLRQVLAGNSVTTLTWK
jgi:glucosylceramidase